MEEMTLDDELKHLEASRALVEETKEYVDILNFSIFFYKPYEEYIHWVKARTYHVDEYGDQIIPRERYLRFGPSEFGEEVKVSVRSFVPFVNTLFSYRGSLEIFQEMAKKNKVEKMRVMRQAFDKYQEKINENSHEY